MRRDLGSELDWIAVGQGRRRPRPGDLTGLYQPWAPGAGRALVGLSPMDGLVDELKQTVCAVVDGVDGRVHHLRLPDLHALSDAGSGSIVELRRFEDAAGRQRAALAVRSDLPLEKQLSA